MHTVHIHNKYYINFYPSIHKVLCKKIHDVISYIYSHALFNTPKLKGNQSTRKYYMPNVINITAIVPTEYLILATQQQLLGC